MNAIHGSSYSRISIKDIVNRNCVIIDDQRTYEKARSIFAEMKIDHIPVVDKNGNVLDSFTRRRAYYKRYYDEGKHDRMNYAKMIMDAAVEGKRLG